MEKKIILSNDSFQEEFMEILAIGILECLKENLIDTCRAEQWLFSPVIAYSLDPKKYNKKFIKAMKYASEIDATKNTDYYMKSLQQLKELFIESFKETTHLPINTIPMRPIMKELL